MKTVVALALSALLMGSCSSSSDKHSQKSGQQPSEYSFTRAGYFGNADVPQKVAFQHIKDVFTEQGEVLSNDLVNCFLVVKTFKSDEKGESPVAGEAMIRFIALTERSCRYEVSSRNGVGYPNKATATTVQSIVALELKKLETGR
ncbi:MAG: hypothetical protein RL095_3268 [Verrucomicrobiota bacterium]|jgi:hypothetical protein